MLNQLALVSQTNRVTMAQLAMASAAIQKQVARDFKPAWGIEGTVDVFEKLEDVPIGYWHIVILDSIPFPAQGIHQTEHGQPFALVQFSDNWTMTASHECLEMLADPFGNRTIAGNSIKRGQGRVEYLVEVCDPCEAADFGYTINGVLVSDFYTPAYFDPVASPSKQYSQTGAIKKPREVLEGGYLSWFDPASRHVFQLRVSEGRKQFINKPMQSDFGNLRSFTDSQMAEFRCASITAAPSGSMMFTAALGAGGGLRRPGGGRRGRTGVDESTAACAGSLQRQIDQLLG
jgi:hypothetical protein